MSRGRFVADTSKVVELAKREVGVTEQPRNSNRTKYGRWFGWDGVAWCAIFVSYIFAAAGRKMPTLSNSQGAAYCPTIQQHAVATGQWRPRSSGYVPKPGDLVIFKFGNRYDHIAILIARLADGRDWTIEGNTDPAGSREGGGVFTKYRRSGVAGYVCVDETHPAATAAEFRRWLAGALLPAVQGLPALHSKVGPDARPFVAKLQEALNVVKNAGLLVDGHYGPKTYLHVADWQNQCRRMRLQVDDPVGYFGAWSKWWLCIALENLADPS